MKFKLHITFIFLLAITSGYCTSPAGDEKIPAFPGAEGYGKYTSGGRGGKILFVTNLNDSGPGSFREAIKTKGARTILFKVAGNIALEEPIEIKHDSVTIAGQSAPGDGICIKNYEVSIEADHVIVRYLRFRLGDEKGQQADAFKGIRQKNIIIDHCSISWATDECASFYDNENFTMQWCLISESLNASVHKKGSHGYGGIWGGMGATYHHNLLAHHTSRNPRLCGARYHKMPEKEIADLRNNVIYNWQHNSAYGGEEGNYNLVANYYKPGPTTQESKRDRIVDPDKPYGQYYVADNYVDGFPEVSLDNWNGGVNNDEPEKVKAEQPVPFVPIIQQPAEQAYQLVLQYAGASLHRDAVDARVVEEVRTGTATYGKNKDGIIDSQSQVGGWPELKSGTVPADDDNDGMPDSWEKTNQLNPKKMDANLYTLDKKYTNLEMYLNSLVPDKHIL